MTKERNTQALVNETLSKDEVMSLLNETLANKGNLNDYLSILKGEYYTWDNEVHTGYIVCHTTRVATPETANDYMPTWVENDELYFMEVTLEEVNNPNGTCHLWEPTFHKLMPITKNYTPKPAFHEGDARALCNYIVAHACRDKWDYVRVPMTEVELKEAKEKDWLWARYNTTKLVPLTSGDIYSYWRTPLTAEERKQRKIAKQEKEAEMIARFSNGELPPAEDSAWYAVLSMGYGEGYDFECKIIDILKSRGINAHIDGERDSFGWVTRGICIDGEVMCLY